MSIDKSVLRQKLLNSRNSFDKHTALKYSQLIQNRLCNTPEWSTAKSIAFYIPLGSEVSTLQALACALKQKKTVAAPVIDLASNHMSFRQFHNLTELKKGPFHLLEPVNDQLCTPEQLDLIIVPGVGFDSHCNRLGFGKGYYDRYLAGYTGTTIALAFELQMVAELIITENDIPVNRIITEKQIISA